MTPAAKVLLAKVPALQLAGLLYVGAAIGIAPVALWRHRCRPPFDASNRVRLAGAVVLGGIAGPILLLLGLRSASAGSVSLLLNLEVAATALFGSVCEESDAKASCEEEEREAGKPGYADPRREAG
jgi:drug/metabolite transporter (DMT)-like permease